MILRARASLRVPLAVVEAADEVDEAEAEDVEEEEVGRLHLETRGSRTALWHTRKRRRIRPAGLIITGVSSERKRSRGEEGYLVRTYLPSSFPMA